MKNPGGKIGMALPGMLAVLSLLALAPARARTRVGAEKPFDLAVFLKTAAVYCGRLESVALYFTCREEIGEKLDLTRDIENPPMPTTNWAAGPGGFTSKGATILSRSTARYRHSLLYDYQCIRDFKGEIRDTRTLLEENGKKKNVPVAKLGTVNFSYGRSLLAPTGLFAERFQGDFKYVVMGREKFERKPVVIVEAKPRPDVPVSQNLFGKAWVDPATNEILKIEWDESRVGRYEIFRERGEKYKLKPKITVITEFSVAKNGLRFPTKAFYEEAYLNERGRKFVRSEMTVEYKDFKFFTVEVEIK
jgi:hypothetical protein